MGVGQVACDQATVLAGPRELAVLLGVGEQRVREEVRVRELDRLDAAVEELALGLDAAFPFDEYPTGSGAVDGVVRLVQQPCLKFVQFGHAERDACLGHPDGGPQRFAEVVDAVLAQLVGAWVVLLDALREVRDGEHRVVSVLCVVGVEVLAGGRREPAAVLERGIVTVRVGAEHGTEGLEAAFGPKLGVQEVHDGQVDEGVPSAQGQCDGGREGAQPEDVERQVHADDGVRMVEPRDEEPLGRWLLQVQRHGLARHERGHAVQVPRAGHVGWWGFGCCHGDGAGQDEILAGNAVRGDGPCRMEHGLLREQGSRSVRRSSAVCFDVEGDDSWASTHVPRTPGVWIGAWCFVL